MNGAGEQPLIVLMLEDRQEDAELVLLELRRAGFSPRTRRVQTEADFLAALDQGYAPGQPWELVLADFHLPQFTGTRALALMRQRQIDVPFILVSGTIGEDEAVQAMQDGAADYLLKDRLARLRPAITRALEKHRLSLEKRAAEQAVVASEQRFRALIENSADGIGVAGADGRLSYVSPAISRLLGVTPESALGRDPFEFVHPDDLPLVKAVLRQVLRRPGAAGQAECRLRHADGTWRTIAAKITNLLAEPSVAGMVFNYRDITARKRDEEALRQAEAQYRQIFENSVEGIFRTSPAGRYLIANPAQARMYHYASAAELMAAGIDLNRDFYVQPGRRQEFIRSLEQQDLVSGFESEVYCQDGSTIWVSESARAVRDAAGALIHYEGTTIDITARKQSEQALRTSEVRYRGLFEGSPIALWEQDFSGVKQRLDALRREGHADLAVYLKTHPEFVSECAAQIKIIDANAGALKMYHGRQKSDLVSSFQNIIRAGANDSFRYELLLIAEGITDFSFDGVDQNLAGEDMNVSLRWSALPGFETSLARVLVSAINITDRVRAEAEVKQRLAELEAVNRISSALRAARVLDEILPLLLDEAIAILGGSAGSIWLYDPVADEVRLEFERGWSNIRVPPLRLGESVPGYVVQSGQVYLSRELKVDPLIPDDLRGRIPAGRGGACVPVRAADRVIGALYVNTELPREFTPADAHLLTTLAEIGGNAIHRMRLHAQTEQQLNRITALRSVDQAISSSLDLRVTLNVLLDQVTTQLAADAADVLLLNPHRQTLDYIAGRGHRGTEVEHLRLRLGEGRAGRTAYDRRLLHVADLRAAPGHDPAAGMVAAEGFVAYFGVPLLAKGLVKGVLEVYHRRPLDASLDWQDFLEALAGQAAIAIDNAALFDGLQRSNLELTLAYDATIAGWSRALDLRDNQTDDQTQRVTDLAVQLAVALGLRDSDLVQVRRGALLHDIGNMGVPTNILLKPGPLDPGEWASLRQHPQHAFDVLWPIAFLRSALDIPYNHHEKWDGSGYPRQLKGEGIPLSARLFAVVDVWDSLLSSRPYRAAWTRDRALAYLREQSGRHFDPRILSVFLQMIEAPEDK